MPAVECEMAALTPLGPDQVIDDPRCPRKECEKTYRAATCAARSGNALKKCIQKKLKSRG